MPRLPVSLFNVVTHLAWAGMLFALTGCALISGADPEDPVTGYYAGDWYGPNPERSLGSVTCTTTPTGPDTWDAFFTATFGGYGEYDVPLEGRREGDKVIFGGSVDLGEEDGGVFEWTGQIVGDDFTGTYTSKMINGSFRMKRTDPPAETEAGEEPESADAESASAPVTEKNKEAGSDECSHCGA